jgi:hypothetical protein
MNKGCFHEVYNYFGTYADTNGDIGVRSPLLNSTADCFNPSNVGTAIGHPQGVDKSKYVTSDQWIDLRTSANAVSEQDELNRVGTKAKSGKLNGIGGVCNILQTINIGEVSYPVESSGGLTYITNGVLNGLAHAPSVEPNFGKYIDLTGGLIFMSKTTFELYRIQRWSNYFNLRITKLVSNAWVDGEYAIELGAYFSAIAVYRDVPEHKLLVGTSVYKDNVLPHPSSGTTLRTDIIGNPSNYPQAVKDRLASGLPLIGMNPLLVNQDGTSAIPDGTTNLNIIFSNKIIYGINRQYSDNSGASFSSQLFSELDAYYSNINNAWNNIPEPLGRIQIANYTAKIPTTQVTDPKAVKLVGNYVTATNSHSIYKGNQLVPGKVNVGNGSNGLESRVIENAEYPTNMIITPDTEFGYILYIGQYATLYGFDNHEDGTVFKRLTVDAPAISTLPIAVDLTTGGNEVYWEYTNSTDKIYNHNTIALDNSNSPAFKFIETIAEDGDGMAHYQVFAQEMVSNVGAYDGDDGEFTQLTNGTLTDDNANTVKTICASIPLNKYIGA